MRTEAERGRVGIPNGKTACRAGAIFRQRKSSVFQTTSDVLALLGLAS